MKKILSLLYLRIFLIFFSQGKMESVFSLLEIYWMVLVDINDRDERGLSIV